MLSLLVLYYWQWRGGGAGAATCWLVVLPARQGAAQGGSQMALGCATAATVPRWLQAAQAVARGLSLALRGLALPPPKVQPRAAKAGAARAGLVGLHP